MKRSDFETLKKMLDGTEYEVLNESHDDNDKFFVIKKKDTKIEVRCLGWKFADFRRDMIEIKFMISDWLSIEDKDDVLEYLEKQLENYLNDEQNRNSI